MRVTSVLPLCLFAACAAAPTVARVPQVPPLAIDVPQADLSRTVGQRADADQRAAPPAVDAAPGVRTEVVHRTFTQVVEVPVEVEVERPVEVHAGEPARTWSYDYERHRRRGTWFPVHTVIGAGIGAAIGRHHGHTRRGIWIGAHTGLLFDAARWWH